MVFRLTADGRTPVSVAEDSEVWIGWSGYLGGGAISIEYEVDGVWFTLSSRALSRLPGESVLLDLPEGASVRVALAGAASPQVDVVVKV